uniref:F-box domain-containing protein n=1 Tax=Leersia perrieri TaxID=77586 RepID=A0A0D9WYW8_9ORYZ
MAPPPQNHLEDEDLLADILLRLPPDDPARLVRASAVCKPWRRVLSHPTFSARYAAFHGPRSGPPVLGVLHNPDSRELDRFIPTTTSAFRPSSAGGARRKRHILDCRHDRVVMYDYDDRSSSGEPGYVVWNPITGDEHVIRNVIDELSHAAVVRTGDSSTSSVIVAFVGVDNPEEDCWVAQSQFYSPDTGEWSLHVYINLSLEGSYELQDRPAAQIGESLYFLGKSATLLRYRYGLARDYFERRARSDNVLTVIHPPADASRNLLRRGHAIVMAAPDQNEIRLGILYRQKLRLWAMVDKEYSPGTILNSVGQWGARIVVDLEPVLPWPVGDNNAKAKERVSLTVAAEIPNFIFATKGKDGVFALDLESLRIRKLCDMGESDGFFPFVSYYAHSWLLSVASSKLPESAGSR